MMYQKIIVPIDHGNRNMKTEHKIFTSGFVEGDCRPALGEYLQYDGRYYALTEQRIPYMRDKTLDDRFFILTLFAVAMEAEKQMLNAKDTLLQAVLPAVLLQTAILSLMMALVGLFCALLLKDFRQFTLAYLVIAIFAATPVFLSANTSVKFDWINYHPFYHVYMGLKNAYFGSAISPVYYVGAIGTIVLLFLAVRLAFHREIGKEG